MKGTAGGREEGCMLTRVGACVCALLSFSLPKLCELSLSLSRARALPLSLSLSLFLSISLHTCMHTCVHMCISIYIRTYCKFILSLSLSLSLIVCGDNKRGEQNSDVRNPAAGVRRGNTGRPVRLRA